MKTILTLLVILGAQISLSPEAEARPHCGNSTYRYISHYTSCGYPVYKERYVAYYNNWGYPVYRTRTVSPQYVYRQRVQPPRSKYYNARPARVVHSRATTFFGHGRKQVTRTGYSCR